MTFSGTGTKSFTIALGIAGTTRTVQIIVGSQSHPPPGDVLGTFINSVTYPDTATFAVQTPTVGDRVVIYGGKIIEGNVITHKRMRHFFALSTVFV